MGICQRQGSTQTADESQRLLHELHVHQIELEAQNEELLHSREEREKLLVTYNELYDLSPFGYFTLNHIGEITTANLSGASQLGVERSRLIGRRFISYLMEEFRPDFTLFLDRLVTPLARASCEVALPMIEGRKQLYVQVEAKHIQDGACLLALTDITERKDNEKSLRRYAHRIMVLEEETRKKFAAELHDGFAQDLTALALNLTIINNGLSRDGKEKLGEKMIISSCLVEEMAHKIREMMVRLRPPVLDSFGLTPALRWYADLFAKNNGIVVNSQLEEIEPRSGDEIETAFFRITQEALANVHKHAAAKSVTLILKRDNGRVRLSIRDDGRGFNAKGHKPHDPFSGCGWGLTLMRERAESVGARFSLNSTPGQGTTICVEIGEDR